MCSDVCVCVCWALSARVGSFTTIARLAPCSTHFICNTSIICMCIIYSPIYARSGNNNNNGGSNISNYMLLDIWTEQTHSYSSDLGHILLCLVSHMSNSAWHPRTYIYILRRSALRWCMRDGGVDGIIEEWTGNMLGSRERCVLFGRWSNRKRKESLGRRERCEAQNTFGSIHGFWIHVVSHKRVLDTWLCRRRVCPFFLYYILHLLRSRARALVWWVRDAVSWWNLGESRGPSEWILCICPAVGDDDNAETRQLRNDE